MTGSPGLLAAPNLLSITRILLVIPFVAVMFSGRRDAELWAALLMIAAAATDRLDGWIARRTGRETEWGRILDPLADKIAAAAVVIVLLLLGRIPLWFVLAVLGRDLLILAGGVFVKARRGVVLPSNATGKWAMGILAAALFALVVQAPAWVCGALIAGSTIMLAASLIQYTSRFLHVLRHSRPGSGGPGASEVEHRHRN